MKRAATTLSLRILIHRVLLRPFVRIFFGVNVYGSENFNGLNQFIIVANHNSHLDVLLLYYILPNRHILRTHVVASREYFSRWAALFHTAEYLFSPIWVDRKAKHAHHLQGMKDLLVSGHNIIIFPEGSRGEPGQLQRFRRGVGKLAEEFKNVPVIPVFLHGPERAFPKKAYVPLPIWNNITIGPPQSFEGTSAKFLDSIEAFLHNLSKSTAASRQKRSEAKKPPALIAVMGIDGSGKSTLSREVSHRISTAYEVCLISDGLEFYEHGDRTPVRPLLVETVREAISSHAKNASSLKNYKLPKLAELLLRDHLLSEVGRWYKPDLVVQDGSPLLNLVGWAILYKEDAFDREACIKALKLLSGSDESVQESDQVIKDFPELLSLKRIKSAGMFLPDIVIMLDVDPAVCCRRIASRGQRVQPHESEEKLGKMRNGYLRVCEVVECEFGIPVLVLEGDLEMDEVTRKALDFINDVIAKESSLDKDSD